jgi:hypothetical protein
MDLLLRQDFLEGGHERRRSDRSTPFAHGLDPRCLVDLREPLVVIEIRGLRIQRRGAGPITLAADPVAEHAVLLEDLLAGTGVTSRTWIGLDTCGSEDERRDQDADDERNLIEKGCPTH